MTRILDNRYWLAGVLAVVFVLAFRGGCETTAPAQSGLVRLVAPARLYLSQVQAVPPQELPAPPRLVLPAWPMRTGKVSSNQDIKDGVRRPSDTFEHGCYSKKGF